MVVDLTPAEQRPYVGSSGTNSVLNLMLGYNGIERLTGMGGRGGLLSSLFGDDAQASTTSTDAQPDADDGRADRGAGGGFPGTGEAGPLRLFTPPLSKEMSWLLPFGLFSMALLVCRSRLRWPLAPQHQAVVVWGGWLLTGGVFFSIAGFFHEYYLTILAAPLAALVDIGSSEVWRLSTTRWWANSLLLVAATITLVLQLITAEEFVGNAWWLAISIAVFLVGAGLLAVAMSWRWPRVRLAGFGLVIAALLVIPGIWSGLTTFNAGGNQLMPSAYSGTQQRLGFGPMNSSDGSADDSDIRINQAMLAYLTEHTQGMTYLMAVPSSMQGADYVLATGRPVLYLGGFNGQDDIASSTDLARMVADGELRYIYWNERGPVGPGGRLGNQADISAWIMTACQAVPAFDATSATSTSGDTPNTVGGSAPDATAGTPDGGMPPDGPGGPGGPGTLYDCGG